ncbi:hypothetical protein ACQ5SO_17115 [Rhodovulum sp. DZ06]|uniref:hypothetical protein n=1 Tax=Rhodovulum sp. DZ06 TaxID=3425126 RepID=UPI003D35895C
MTRARCGGCRFFRRLDEDVREALGIDREGLCVARPDPGHDALTRPDLPPIHCDAREGGECLIFKEAA